MDYDTLAKKLGGQKIVSNNTVDYDSLASNLGGSAVSTETVPKKQGFLKTLGKGLIRSELGFGKSIADALPGFVPGSAAWTNKQNEELMKQGADTTNNLLKMIKEKKTRGEDVSRLETALQQHIKDTSKPPIDINETNASINKSAKQVFGEGLGVAADIAAFGTYGNAAKGAKSFQVLTKAQRAANIAALPKLATTGQAFLRGAKEGAKTSGAIGSALGLTGALQDDDDIGGIIKKTVTGGATGAVIGGVLGGLSERSAFKRTDKAAKLKEQAVEQYKRGLEVTKEKYKQKAEEIIPDLLDQKTWGTRRKLLEKANKGIKLSGDEYEKLGELKGMIGTEGLLGKIDDEIAKYTTYKPGLTETSKELLKLTGEGTVSSVNTTRVKALQSLKSDILAITAFDAAGKNPVAYQESLRKLARDYGTELYEGRKSMKTIFDNKTLSQVKKVDGAIRGLLNTQNPEYAKINEIYHLNNELFDILAETAQRKGGQKWWSLIRSVSSGTGATAGSVAGGSILGAPGAVGGAVVGGMVGNSMTTILNSTWWNTMRAVQKNNLANKLLQMNPGQRNQAILTLGRLGTKAVEDILNQ